MALLGKSTTPSYVLFLGAQHLGQGFQESNSHSANENLSHSQVLVHWSLGTVMAPNRRYLILSAKWQLLLVAKRCLTLRAKRNNIKSSLSPNKTIQKLSPTKGLSTKALSQQTSYWVSLSPKKTRRHTTAFSYKQYPYRNSLSFLTNDSPNKTKQILSQNKHDTKAPFPHKKTTQNLLTWKHNNSLSQQEQEQQH